MLPPSDVTPKTRELADKFICAVAASLTPDGVNLRESVLQWPGWSPLNIALSAYGQKWFRHELMSLGLNKQQVGRGMNSLGVHFKAGQVLSQGVNSIIGWLAFPGATLCTINTGVAQYVPQREDIKVTRVEADTVAAQLVSSLHPTSETISSDLQRLTFDHKFDIVVAHMPKADTTTYDPEFEFPEGSYTVARSVRLTKPGGYTIIIRPRQLLDSPSLVNLALGNSHVRASLRLPADVISGGLLYRGEKVNLVDVLILQQPHETIDTVPGWAGGSSLPYEVDFDPLDGQTHHFRRKSTVSGYWRDYPDHVAGKMKSNIGTADVTVVADSDMDQSIKRAFTSAQDKLVPIPRPSKSVSGNQQLPATSLDTDRLEGSFLLEEDGAISRIVNGERVPLRKNKELSALISLRDKAVSLFTQDEKYRNTSPGEDKLAKQRLELRAAYEDYVAAFGYLNRGTLVQGAIDPETGQHKLSWRRPPMGGFAKDPQYLAVLACESYDPDTGVATPAPVLYGPINRVEPQPEQTDDPYEAVNLATTSQGYVDLKKVARLLGVKKAKARKLIHELVYPDPEQDMNLIPSARYLSGDIRAKRKAALKAGLERNVAALDKVKPRNYGPQDIYVRLGLPWMGVDTVQDFVEEVLGQSRSRVTMTPAVGVWHVDSHWTAQRNIKRSLFSTNKNPLQVLEIVLNNRPATVYAQLPNEAGKVVRTLDTVATQELMQAIQNLQEAFASWVWTDMDRAKRLVGRYNRIHRTLVPYRGNPDAVSLPGLANSVTMWEWQKSFVDRMVTTPRVLCAHPVGAGKTLTMIAGVMALRSKGIVNRPLIVVPGHLLEQVARQAHQAYPGAKVLLGTADALSAKNRASFAERSRSGDWDMVVITHSAFSSMPLNHSSYLDILTKQRNELLREIRSQIVDQDRLKIAAKAVDKVMRQISKIEQEQAKTKAGTVYFNDLGVDYLAVDEIHAFKRLPIDTNLQGFHSGGSKRAEDLFLKVDYLGSMYGDRPHLSGFSATPWSNTLAEIYVWHKLFAPADMERMGVGDFNEWVRQYVTISTKTEVAPTGGYRLIHRPRDIVNANSLMASFSSFAEVLDPQEMNLDLPEAKWVTVATEPTDDQLKQMVDISERADELGSGKHDDDHIFRLFDQGRKLALDPALTKAGGSAPKLERLAELVSEIYHENKNTVPPGLKTPGALQLLMCDLGTPNSKGSSTYGRVKKLLVSHGVPADMVRFAHEATTPSQRDALFAQCRNGEVAVLIGSSQKVGVGTNIQTRLIALHHVDAPWRPSEVTQREGRAIRHGNSFKKVTIYRHATSGTFDAYMWQLLERKARFITTMHTGLIDSDIISDISDMEISFAEVKAIAAGDPLLLDQAKLQSKLVQLEAARNLWTQQSIASKTELEQLDHNLHQISELTLDQNIDRAIAYLTDSVSESLTRAMQLARRNGSAQVENIHARSDGKTIEVTIFYGQIAVLSKTYDASKIDDFKYLSKQELKTKAKLIKLPKYLESARQDARRQRKQIRRWLKENQVFEFDGEMQALEAQLASLNGQIDSRHQHISEAA